MIRPAFLIGEPEPGSALSARKLLLEAAKFNVITAHSVEELFGQLELFPNIAGLVLLQELGDCEAIITQVRQKFSGKMIVLLSPNPATQCKGADHYLSSHDPQVLVDLMRSKFGDPRAMK